MKLTWIVLFFASIVWSEIHREEFAIQINMWKFISSAQIDSLYQSKGILQLLKDPSFGNMKTSDIIFELQKLKISTIKKISHKQSNPENPQ